MILMDHEGEDILNLIEVATSQFGSMPTISAALKEQGADIPRIVESVNRASSVLGGDDLFTVEDFE